MYDLNTEKKLASDYADASTTFKKKKLRKKVKTTIKKTISYDEDDEKKDEKEIKTSDLLNLPEPTVSEHQKDHSSRNNTINKDHIQDIKDGIKKKIRII